MLTDFEGFKANGTIAPSVFVKIDTTGDQLVLQAGAGDDPLAISQVGQRDTPGLTGSNSAQAALAGDMIQLYGPGRICFLTIGGTVTRGDYLKSDANGKGITTTTSGDKVGARALWSGASGNLIKVIVLAPGTVIH